MNVGRWWKLGAIGTAGTSTTTYNDTIITGGGGGGGGTVDGFGTTGYIAIWTASNTIQNSPIDFGITTANVVTIAAALSGLSFAIGLNTIIPPTATGYHGSGVGDVKVQMSDGTGTSTHLAVFNTTGGLTDGGTIPAQVYPGAGVPVSTGSAWTTSLTTSSVTAGTAGATADGGAATPTTGTVVWQGVIPYSGIITGWFIMATTSGSAQWDVKTASSISGIGSTSSIVASAPPVMSSAQQASSTTLTGWTTAVTAGTLIQFILTSVVTCTKVTVELQIQKT
jgi:hypothetical protein